MLVFWNFHICIRYEVLMYTICIHTNKHATQQQSTKHTFVHWDSLGAPVLVLSSLYGLILVRSISHSRSWTSLVNDTAEHHHASACIRDIYVICILTQQNIFIYFALLLSISFVFIRVTHTKYLVFSVSILYELFVTQSIWENEFYFLSSISL